VPKITEDFAAMQAEIQALPGFLIRDELFTLDRSRRLFAGNARDLTRLLADAQKQESRRERCGHTRLPS
jgi:hypothetical protein